MLPTNLEADEKKREKERGNVGGRKKNKRNANKSIFLAVTLLTLS